ncbi:adenylyl-sulfate kinase [Candidatus Bathyarchaeota archaeon]|nr:adenylyl-sulfate kinase [Candidatus Bathyarchaeota archaeon]
MKQGWAIWITGLPASGKSTIARHLVAVLESENVQVQVLESDELRDVLTPNPTYSQKERDIFYNSMVYIGTLLADNGVNVLFDAVANRREWRNKARENIDRFMEVYVNTPLEICKKRDPKGIYEKAEKGEATTVPGIQAEYEKIKNPEVTVDGTVDPKKSAEKIIEVMRENEFII